MTQTTMTVAEKKEKMGKLHEVTFAGSPEGIKPWENVEAKNLAAKNLVTRENLRRIETTARENLGSKDLIMKDILDSRKKIGM
ncbi:hypothetical protein CON53_10795 [Bacillus cereus]|uniref:hypothetical protein n=1 Tax=Bacillus cereus group TaxID=86661 RepID=UPI000BED4134|nr:MULTISPECIES: hypothetical protein [Bacillus cereus group]PEE18087.1 hypothetical protein CON53_10795 [Bacillus cereus]PGP20060.1 hypothetical protein COA01_20280 [Bacillus cereus]PHB62634.1 hypothetical protein COE87_13995 [Bacillus wiedmannii]